MSEIAVSKIPIATAFSAMALRSGKILGTPANDEPIWNIPSFFEEARDLGDYPESFQRVYRTYASLMKESTHTTWSPTVCLAFVMALSQHADEWFPTIFANWNKPYSAGVLMMQTSYMCAAAAHTALNYPNTRSYSLHGPERLQHARALRSVLAAHADVTSRFSRYFQY